MRARPVLFLAILLAVIASGARPSAAAEHAKALLLAETTGWVRGQPVRLGLRLELAPGWHTYWSNPGDAGLPPSVTVALDGGTPEPAALQFPAPQRLPTGPLMGYGYAGEVLLPFSAAPAIGKTGSLQAAVRADWLVCASVCVPEHADLALTLPQAGSAVASDR